MTSPTPHYSDHDRTALALAFLAYLGEEPGCLYRTPYSVSNYVLGLIESNIPNVEVLCQSNKDPDWSIVWGPAFEFVALDQENMFFVAQQQSVPTNYMVVVRGTNYHSVCAWLDDDFKVKYTTLWSGPSGSTNATTYGSISEGTNNAFSAVMATKPCKKFLSRKHLPGYPNTIEEFLAGITTQAVNITFCGHSLAGALAPTIALYFAQSQGSNGTWDANNNATIQLTTFAGPTPGNNYFASYLNSIIPITSFNRYNNSNDVVPLAWAVDSFATIENLYQSSGDVDAMTSVELALYEILKANIANNAYTQMGNSQKFVFEINTVKAKGTSFVEQVEYQHHVSYPTQLGVTEVLKILKSN